MNAPKKPNSFQGWKWYHWVAYYILTLIVCYFSLFFVRRLSHEPHSFRDVIPGAIAASAGGTLAMLWLKRRAEKKQ